MKNKPKISDTINVGIDLGTTNSAIAISLNGNIELVKRGPGEPEYTPSVFGIDKANNKSVGQNAYERLYRMAKDEEFSNYKAEIKRLMGTGDTIRFERLNQSMTPEEISAEILISLKEAVSRKYPDFSINSAVITIPAFFSALKSEATKRAGELAGFKHVVLLQEPIAAAMAYGYNNTEDQNWLVYDLGGGTFDVALMSSKDSILTVLGQNGDDHLGGKDFDNLIVDEIIKPALKEKYKIQDFDRNNDKYKAVFARLKATAEAAKINLSYNESTIIEIDDRLENDEYKDIYISIDFTRKQFEKLISTYIKKTIELTKKTLRESGVKPSTISRIILVGGSTQVPYIRESLGNEFNCTIDTTVDPLTVVAKGACVYSMSQKVPLDIMQESYQKNSDGYKIILNYDPMTSEEEQTITGKIDQLNDSEKNYYIQIQSDSNYYCSPKIKLNHGKFHDEIAIEKSKTATYWIYLFDEDGNTLPVFPDSFTVTEGITVQHAPIPHTVGVIYAKNNSNFKLARECEVFFEKGSAPPLSKTKPFKTLKKLSKGEKVPLEIEVYQGDFSNPDNNIVITTLGIDGAKLPYDLPEKSNIDITIKVDKNMSIFVEYYLPGIDIRGNARVDMHSQPVDTKKLSKDLKNQKILIKELANDMSVEEKQNLYNTIESLEKSIQNADSDTDDRMKSERDMQELKSEIEKIQERLSLPQLKKEFEEKLDKLNSALEELEDQTEKERISEVSKAIKAEGDKVIKDGNRQSLVRYIEEIQELFIIVIRKLPLTWLSWLDFFKLHQKDLTDPILANDHISKADKAAENKNFEELEYHIDALIDLMPKDSNEEIDIAGITK